MSSFVVCVASACRALQLSMLKDAIDETDARWRLVAEHYEKAPGILKVAEELNLMYNKRERAAFAVMLMYGLKTELSDVTVGTRIIDMKYSIQYHDVPEDVMCLWREIMKGRGKNNELFNKIPKIKY